MHPVEEFELKQKIYSSVASRQTFIYLRNRLSLLQRKDSSLFTRYKKDLAFIINNSESEVKIELKGSVTKDININVLIALKKDEILKDISLLGSGSLQIMEILLHIYEDKKDLNIILLDEPDSHIHRDIQKRLLSVLKDHCESSQLFITTHNESLIRSVDPEYIYHINNEVSNEAKTTCIPITNETLPGRKRGISPSYHSKIIRDLGSESSLDLLNALEADRIIFVEGTGDSEYIQRIIRKNNKHISCVFWCFDGLDNLLKEIEIYKTFLSSIGSSQKLWNKCRLIIDADYMTDYQKTKLKEGLSKKLCIPTYVWKSYTLESSILRDIEIITKVICSRNKSLELNSVRKILDEVISNTKSDLLNEISLNSAFQRNITGQIAKRVKSLSNIRDLGNVIKGGEANYFINYKEFADKELENGRIDHLCRKEDVDNILKITYERCSISKNNVNDCYFIDILNDLMKQEMFEEWKCLVEIILKD
jgi:predicted ATP-dependent endonuclease of OLD family